MRYLICIGVLALCGCEADQAPLAGDMTPPPPPSDGGLPDGDPPDACQPGGEGCPCDDGACGEGLYCEGDVCAACLPGLPDCPCGPDDMCGAGLQCVDARCIECPPDRADCPCDADGGCGAGLVCDDARSSCRPPFQCAEVDCAPNQLCGAEPGADAACLPECMPGFTWDADTATCDPEPGLLCAPGGPDGIAEMCADLNRACLETEDGAICGVCLDGYTDDAGALMQCRALDTCASLDCAGADRGCAEPPIGEDAACADCLEGFVEVDGECRPVEMGCDDAAAARCAAEARACLADGECGGCIEGFVEEGGVCVAVGPPPTCEPGAPGSIEAECAARGRGCVQPEDQPAVCGDCLDGLVDGPDGRCEPPAPACDPVACAALDRSCDGAEGADCGACRGEAMPLDPLDPNSPCEAAERCDVPCGEGEFCVEVGGVFRCEARACPAGQALRRNSAIPGDPGRCVVCNTPAVCAGAGATGRYWPETMDNDDECICETEPGYFYNSAADIRAPEPCDADGDGWLSARAAGVAESGDAGLLANLRCDIRTIDRFELRNEWGQRLELVNCAGSGLTPTDGPLACDGGARSPIGLFEPSELDTPGSLPPDVRPWVAACDPAEPDCLPVGRRPRAAELNPLTKACVQPRGDYNGNGLRDVDEHHASAPVGADPRLHPFIRVSYFMELHDGHYAPPRPTDVPCDNDEACRPGVCDLALGRCVEAHGRYVIRERSRCDDDFPLRYAEDAGAYWRSCTRNRDAAYTDDVVASPPVGLDFARWSCDAAVGSCPVPPPPSGAAIDGIPPHGLCDPAVTLPPADGIWRGMSHHSQFKCVQIDDAPDVGETLPPQRITADALGTTHQLDACHIACPPGDPDCIDDCGPDGCVASSRAPVGAGGNPSDPVIRCAPVTADRAPIGTVGFTALLYDRARPEGTYTRGCIDEWAPGGAGDRASIDAWKLLCPGYRVGLPPGVDSVVARGNPGNFGRLLCGCNEFYNGAECERGCPHPQYGGPPENDGPGCLDGFCPLVETDDPADAPRALGWWACADIGRTAGTVEVEALGPVLADPEPGGWVVRDGDIAPLVPDAPRCNEDDVCTCDDGDPDCRPTGWRVRR